MLACDNGNSDIVSLLLQGGANKNAINDDGVTAKFYAKQKDYSHIVELLKSHEQTGAP